MKFIILMNFGKKLCFLVISNIVISIGNLVKSNLLCINLFFLNRTQLSMILDILCCK